MARPTPALRLMSTTCGSETDAAVLLTSVMNSRRPMLDIGLPPLRVGATKGHRRDRRLLVYPPLSLAPSGRQVLRLDLNSRRDTVYSACRQLMPSTVLIFCTLPTMTPRFYYLGAIGADPHKP